MKTSLRSIHEVALSNPGHSEVRVQEALEAANKEAALLEECLMWIGEDEPEAVAIRRDIEAIKSLPGFRETAV